MYTHTHIYVINSLCYIGETNKTLQINYIPIKIILKRHNSFNQCKTMLLVTHKKKKKNKIWKGWDWNGYCCDFCYLHLGPAPSSKPSSRVSLLAQWYRIHLQCRRLAGDAGSIPGQEDILEKEMATHSSILAWEIPWTEEPGLQSMGSQRVTWLKWLSMHIPHLNWNLNLWRIFPCVSSDRNGVLLIDCVQPVLVTEDDSSPKKCPKIQGLGAKVLLLLPCLKNN